MALASKTHRPPRRRASGEIALVTVPRERESGIRLTARSEPVDELRAIASALLAATLGFDVCARRARTNELARRMTSLAEATRAAAADAASRVPAGVRRPSTSERMRWEWLASTASLLGGRIEGRIADEANRHLEIASAAAAKLDDDVLATRIEALAATGRAAARAASDAPLPSTDTVA